jgi:hypothetical protein
MAWKYTKAGRPIDRPDSQRGFWVEGPLTADDWREIVDGILEELIDQAKREASE